MQTLRIFISSPGDVAEERDRARQVVESLRRRYSGRFYIKPVLWEELPLQADMSFQQGIDLVLSKEHGVDIAVFILWSRLGSPLGALIRKPDGTEYRSGTERELDLMLTARKQSGGTRPALMIYTRRDETSFDERLRGKPTKEKEDLIAQKKLVEQFIAEEFHDGGSGHNVRAYHSFDRPVTFSQRLRAHLTELLDDLAGGGMTEAVWDIEKQGPPFLGLEAFQPQHTDVFFGRETETLEARHALREQARNGCAVLLLSGASGSGKSSLARAGVLPAIVENELDEQVAAWRTVIATPLELGTDPLTGLVRRLAADDVLPDLRGDTESLDDLIEGLRRDPALTLRLRFKDAFARAGKRQGGGVRVLLVLDQLEELFATAAVSDTARKELLEALEALARSGHVWVLATVRSDFWAQVQAQPALVRMTEGRGLLPVLPPETDSLRRLIEEPARLAGLSYEQRDGQGLADRILRDAAAHAELLPLLEYVLRELFEQRTAERVLTWDAYEKLGGVEGALGQRAAQTFDGLPAEAQATLDELLPLLVTLDVAGDQSAVRRRCPLSELTATPARRMLTEALVQSRFLTTDKDGDTATASLAHEALLRRWERASEWIRANRDFLRLRARVELSHALWEESARDPSRLLPAGLPLEEGRKLLQTGEARLAVPLKEFIRLSTTHHEAAARRRTRLRRLVMAGLCALSAISVLGGIVAVTQRREAEAQREQTKAALTKARIQLERSQLEEGRAWFERARTAAGRGDNFTAIMLAGRAVGFHGYGRRKQETPDIEKQFPSLLGVPMTEDAENESQRVEESKQVREFISNLHPTLLPIWSSPLIAHDTAGVTSVAFSPDGTRVASGDAKTIKLWDIVSGKELLTLEGHTARVTSVAFNPDGTRVASGSEDHTVRLWDAANGNELATLQGNNGEVTGVAFSPDGARVVSGAGDLTVRLWDAESGKEFATLLGHTYSVTSVAFSPDGTRVASGSDDNTIKLWDAASGKELVTLQGHTSGVSSVAFSPDGTRVASASHGHRYTPGSREDHTIKVWEAANGKELATLQGHTKGVASVAFSPDGTRVASGSWDNTIRLWDAASGKELVTIRGLTSGVSSVAFSPEGTRLSSRSRDGTIKLWDVTNSKDFATLQAHTGFVWSVAFSPDGARVASGSEDKTIKLWDVASGKMLATLQGHTGTVSTVAFSFDGIHVFSSSLDNTVKQWEAGSGKEIATLPQSTGLALMAFALMGSTTRDGQLRATMDRNIIHLERIGALPDLDLLGHVRQGLFTLAGKEVQWSTNPSLLHSATFAPVHPRADGLAALAEPGLSAEKRTTLRLCLLCKSGGWRAAVALWKQVEQEDAPTAKAAGPRLRYLTVLCEALLSQAATEKPAAPPELLAAIASALTPEAMADPLVSLPLAQALPALVSRPDVVSDETLHPLLERLTACAKVSWLEAVAEAAKKRGDDGKTTPEGKARLQALLRQFGTAHS